MILTTTNTIEGFKIIEYKGIVSGVEAAPPNPILTFNTKKYYTSVRERINDTKEKAFQQLVANAKKLNANAIVGINVEIEVAPTSYTIVSVTGTAVYAA
ncbi:MAG TPA: heavy metal-binding domain-containing protein [Aquaticitalea sp.]|nr:heavy metal-binding domain-containing protein [Aquaticitalea sp.]